MNCNCKYPEIILGIVILGFVLWESTVSWLPSKWIIVGASALLILHALFCKHCSTSCGSEESKLVSKESTPATVEKKPAVAQSKPIVAAKAK